MLKERGEVFGTGLQVDFVRRPSEMAYNEFILRTSEMQRSFEVAEVLCALEQSIADKSNAIALVEH